MRIARWSFLAVLFLGAVFPLVRNYDFLNDAHTVLVLLLVGTNLIFVPKNKRDVVRMLLGAGASGKSNLLFLLVGIIGVAADIWTGSLFHLIVWCFLLAIAVMELASPTKLEGR